MNYAELFNSLYPGFFQEESIRTMPENWVFTELLMDLRKDLPKAVTPDSPNGITFGEYHGELAALRNAVSMVDEDWVRYFNEGDRFYCAFAGETIAAFCGLADMGRIRGFHIGDPGCVGTVPEFRRRGIGLEMVRLATETLKRDGYDLSWIHYTHLADWYMKLGYKPILCWNSGGFLQNTEKEKLCYENNCDWSCDSRRKNNSCKCN
ncbi:MAG: GNAT family N-acetyltransferase [Butyrivibrio sp.]|nr:GNAT family N-acetyltransferase [Butyrivibrio sp.]